MLLNYLKLALRRLLRNPFFTFINIAGLSVGFAVFFILWPFTQSELASDQFIQDHQKIVRPFQDFRWTDNGGESWGQLKITSVPSNAASEMRNHSAVRDVTRYIPQGGFWANQTPDLKPDLIVTLEQPYQSITQIRLENSICADQNFFEFFDLPFIHGDRRKALSSTEAIVLSQRTSKSLFGAENPVGKMLRINAKQFQVTGVFKDIPRNSHLKFEAAFSNISTLKYWNSVHGDWVFQYFKMDDPSRLPDILNANKESLIGEYLKQNPHVKIDFKAQPLAEIAFSQGNNGDVYKPKSKLILNTLGGVALVVLIMGWANYVNLSVSRAKTRFKDIAVRKVSGATLSNFLLQFICQSTVINVLAALIGMTIIQVVRVLFDQVFNIYIVSFYDLDIQTLLFFLATFVIGIIATACYPAWIAFQHTTRQLLTNNIPSRKSLLTTGLTTAQYVIALSLITGVFVMNSQLEFILDKDWGIDKGNLVVIESPILGLEENGNQKMVEFARLIKSKLNTEGVSLSARVSGEMPWSPSLRRVGSNMFYGIDTHGGVDEAFIPTFKLKLVAGRNFLPNETKFSIILSRFASERLGFNSPDDAIGTIIESLAAGEWIKVEVIGVIEDYRMAPYILEEGSSESVTGRGQCLTYLNSGWPAYVPERISLKLNSEFSNISEVEKLYNQLFPGNIFNWYFLDENINRLYGDQKIARNQITLFTVIAIAVACLGLLGMISNKVVERNKEMSIRRILGARYHQVVSLLLSSTGAQIGIALIIGLPVAWKFSQQYLEKYTDRIELQWWHFVLPVLILIAIMLCTIAGVLWKVVKYNPVDSLRNE